MPGVRAAAQATACIHFRGARSGRAGSWRVATAVLRRLPPLEGAPIRVERSPGLRDRRGEVHGAAFLRERRIALDCTERELARIFAHELFHFIWLRCGNTTRWSYEHLLQAEWGAAASGELGWSAEWRKNELTAADLAGRTRRWREYCCESFCDTAAWIYSGREHAEFTLDKRFRQARRKWFRAIGDAAKLAV